MTSSSSNIERSTLLARDVRKYIGYFLESKGFTRDLEPPDVSEVAVRAARSIRGIDGPPAIFLHGIMPRSGTVYLGQLLRLHPDIHAYPHQLWELPTVTLSPELIRLGKRFLLEYKPNIGRVGEGDFLPIFGAALLGFLREGAPADRRVLAKFPSVQYITHFFSMFPHEKVVLLVRDGRDVVHSTLRTWPKLNFVQVCLRWRRSAQAVLKAIDLFEECHPSDYLLTRFEDVVANPANFVKGFCAHFSLDPDGFPYEDIGDIKVIGSSKLTDPGEDVTWRWVPKPDGFKPTAYWRDWPRSRKMLFKLIAGRPLIDLGYCEDLDW